MHFYNFTAYRKSKPRPLNLFAVESTKEPLWKMRQILFRDAPAIVGYYDFKLIFLPAYCYLYTATGVGKRQGIINEIYQQLL